MTTISPELQTILVERARPHYTDALPYHNWAHAQDVMQSAASIVLRSISPEVVRNGPLIAIGTAWHDADYHLEDLGDYSTKEERSAELAVRSLPELNTQQLDVIYSAIIDTTVEKKVKDSLTGEVVHAGDLGYFAAPHPHFMHRLGLMREEWGSPSWGITVERTVAFGGHVITEAQKVMPQLLNAEDADAWVLAIESNLVALQQKYDTGEL
ncbi:MAG: hypothetical protein WAQ27_01260 [Candidatus Microsaccharimonas sp.]